MNFLSNINLNKNQLLNAVIHNVAADPASGNEGQLIYRTDTDEIKYYDGTQWVSISSGSITQFSVAGDTGSTTIVDLDTLTINTGSTGVSTAVSGDTLTISLSGITNAELDNDSITLTNTDGHLTFANSGVVALGGSIAIETTGLVDTTTDQSVGGNKTFTGNTVFTGNVDIQGTVTNVDSTNLLVEDALIVVARNQATGTLDAGIVVERGTDSSKAMFWDESADEFVFADVGTEDGSTSGNVTISSYSTVRTGNLITTGTILAGVLQDNTSPTHVLVPNGSNVVQRATIADLLDGAAVESIAASGTAPLNLSVDAATGDVTLSGSVDLATDTEARTSTSDAVLVTPGNLRALSYAETIAGDGSTTSFSVSHNLGSRDVIVQVYDTTSFETVFTDVTRTTTSAVTIDFGFAPAVSSNYRVLVKLIG